MGSKITSFKSLEHFNHLRTRAADANKLIEAHGSKILTSTFYSDAAKVWNNAPDCIKQCQSVYAVKKQIKQYITSLPI